MRSAVDFYLEALLAGTDRPPVSSADQDEILVAELESRGWDDDRAVEPAGAVAESLPAGPGLATWLSRQEPDQLTGWDLPAMAAAYRKVASWAQAGELEMVARIAARSAEQDDKIGLTDAGRPAQVSADATAQVSLGLTLSPYGAEAWTQLAVTLRWRLARTGAALADGVIDLYRARIIAEATAPLTEEAARAVEDAVLPKAGDLTYGQLHAAVRRAVLAADPEGAEHRRQSAERRAKVSLYPDEDCTATLTGTRLPAAHAAAAMARISAMAQALKASGAGGGIHLLRAQVYLGLLLGTMPLIPPPADGPPDSDPPDSDPPPDDPDNRPPGDTPPGDTRPGAGPLSDTGPGGGRDHDGRRSGDGMPGNGGDSSSPARVSQARAPRSTGPPSRGDPGRDPGPWPDAPPLTDADMPEDDGYRDTGPPLPDGYVDWDPDRGDPLDDHFTRSGVVPAWPPVPPTVPAGSHHGASEARAAGRPPRHGLLDVTLPWVTLAGAADRPGTLGRIGPVTAHQGRELARLARRDQHAQWRVIVTDAERHAVAVARIPRPHPPPGLEPPGLEPPGHTAVVGRVTVILPAADLDGTGPARGNSMDEMLAAILAVGRRAFATASQAAAADQHAPGGCAHTMASPAYRPPARLREYVIARDHTCRNPRCGHPAWRGDLDHTIPFDRGGLTCACDLGPVCRRDHQLKQRPGWGLRQPRPGHFEWTTPAGRTYTVEPHRHE